MGVQGKGGRLCASPPPLLESFVKATLGPFPVAVLGSAVAFGTRTYQVREKLEMMGASGEKLERSWLWAEGPRAVSSPWWAGRLQPGPQHCSLCSQRVALGEGLEEPARMDQICSQLLLGPM